MKHNLQHNAIGEIDFEGERWTFTFFYENGSDLIVKGVKRFQPQKTGCYVLFTDYEIFVVRPTFKYYTEKKEDAAWVSSKYSH